jgi:hypothetical protein
MGLCALCSFRQDLLGMLGVLDQHATEVGGGLVLIQQQGRCTYTNHHLAPHKVNEIPAA